MSTESDEALIGRITRQCQIIIGALITGVVVFLGIAAMVDVTQKPGGGAGGGPAVGPAVPPGLGFGELVTWLAIGFAVLDVPLSFIVPYLIVQQNRRAIAAGKWPVSGSSLDSSAAAQSDATKLATVYQIQLIAGAALNEGAAFFAGVAYLLGSNPIALGVAIALLGLIVFRFPTPHRVALWLARQEEMLFLERQAAI